MNLTPSNLNLLFKAISTRFADGMQSASDVYKKIAQEVTSGTSIEHYPVLKDFPAMREWVGNRVALEAEANMLEVENKTYETTLKVPVDAIADDKYGFYANLAQGLGKSAADLWDDLTIGALTASPNWIDGAAFFGTTRKFDKSTIANKTTSALSASTYGAARTAMMSYTGYNKKPLNIIPDTLIVGPALEAEARRILMNEFVVNGSATESNPYKGTAELVISSRLVGDYANYWALICTKSSLPAIIVQKRQDSVLTRMDKDDDQNVFQRNEIYYGAKSRGAAALVMPQLIYLGAVSA